MVQPGNKGLLFRNCQKMHCIWNLWSKMIKPEPRNYYIHWFPNLYLLVSMIRIKYCYFSFKPLEL